MSFQTRKSFVCLRNTNYDILDENREACDCLIDCQVITTVKAQKSMKSIVSIVHLPSVVGQHKDALFSFKSKRKYM